MKICLVGVIFEGLENSIKNTAEYYPEGRNILIYCLSRNSKCSEKEAIEWLKENKIKVKDIDEFKITDGSDRIK